MISAIIENMLKGGMFGDASHYYATIEYQGRGTPHTHLAVSLLHYLVSQRVALDKKGQVLLRKCVTKLKWISIFDSVYCNTWRTLHLNVYLKILVVIGWTSID